MTPTDVRVTLPPDGANDYEWWYDATQAWVKAAGDAGIVVDEQYLKSSYVKTLHVRVGDMWYDMRVNATEVCVFEMEEEPRGIHLQNDLIRIAERYHEEKETEEKAALRERLNEALDEIRILVGIIKSDDPPNLEPFIEHAERLLAKHQ
jgi:hypothetical protein